MDRLARAFKALGDDTRLGILGVILEQGPVCVCEVEAVLGITQSKASRHLRYLRDAGVLEAERAGLIVNYRLPADPGELEPVLKVLGELLAGRSVPAAGKVLARIRAERAAAEAGT